MKKHLLVGLLAAICVGAAAAQKIAKPTLSPKPETDAQKSTVAKAQKWITANRETAMAFLAWAKTYEIPAR